jgi:hypothetical protein
MPPPDRLAPLRGAEAALSTTRPDAPHDGWEQLNDGDNRL